MGFEQRLSSSPGNALELAAQNGASHDIIGAVGGDGTVFEVINGLLAAERNRPDLAIVPFGTGNDAAHAFGIRHANDTLEALRDGSSRLMDLIRVECHSGGTPVTKYAALFASVGITSDLLRHTTPRLKRLCGRRSAYLVGLLFALRTYSSPKMRLDWEAQRLEGRFTFACASNGETFGGGIRVAPGARTDDGLLNLNLIEEVSPWEALKHLIRLRQGRHITHPKVSYRTSPGLEINAEHAIEVAADGDLIGWTPAHFTVAPKALRIITPRR